MKSIWSTPYLGVAHLQGVTRGHQVTVVDYGEFATLMVLRGISQLQPDTNFPSAVEAKAEGENQALALHLIDHAEVL